MKVRFLISLKEQKTNCEKDEVKKLALAKHSWANDHCIKWNEPSILALDSRWSSNTVERIRIVNMVNYSLTDRTDRTN